MRVRFFLSLILFFFALSTEAKQSLWLTQMIAKQEGLNPKETLNKKEKGFFSTHALVFFYGSLCPHCKQFSPIVKQWATHNKADVLPLSLDNQPLAEFPRFLPATSEWINAAFQGNAINYPALFVVSHRTKALYPVGFGSMPETELNERMDRLISKIKIYENKGRL